MNNVLACGTAPENYAGKICNLKPARVIFIDAVDMGLKAGAVKILPAAVAGQGITTHNAGLNILAGYIEAECGARVYVLGIQPETLSGKMTGKISKTGDKIAAVLGEQNA